MVISPGNESCGLSHFSNEFLVTKSLIRFRMSSDIHLAIKRLVLCAPLRLYNLKSFDNLTDLRIMSTTSLKLPNPFIISLKNLVDFEANFSHPDVRIVLEAPKLARFFVSFRLEQLKILHPRSVKTAYSMRLCPTVKQMVNLETLETCHFAISDAGYLFGDLKQLKKFGFFVREDNLNVINEHLRSAQLSNPNLRIFYRRIDINANPMQNAELDRAPINCLNDQSLVIYQKYADAFDENLNLNQSVLWVQDFQRLSVELIRKLTLLDLQVLGEITDDEKWRELLKRPYLNRLTIRSSVKEEQLNMIPEHCPFVNFVGITSFEGGDWLLRLKYLQGLSTTVLFDFELLKKLIRQNCYLKYIRASESYVIRIENGVVECITNGEIVLREPRPVFLQTIELVDVWSELFE